MPFFWTPFSHLSLLSPTPPPCSLPNDKPLFQKANYKIYFAP